MQTTISRPLRSMQRATPLILALGLGACSERAALGPAPVDRPTPAYVATALRCTASVSQETFGCEEIGSSVRSSMELAIAATDSQARRAAAGPSRFPMSNVGEVLLGGPGKLLSLFVTNTGTEDLGSINRLTTWVRVRNLLTQSLGTTDGATADPDGIVVFFPTASGSNPLVVGGSGTVSVVNSDTSHFWTAAGEVGFKYAGRVPPGGYTGLQKWIFDASSSVTSFSITMYVAARVLDESPATLTATAPPATFTSLVTNAGLNRTCGQRTGTSLIYCWGQDLYGSNGSGALSGRSTPTNAVSAPSLASIVLGSTHGCGVTSAGAAHCWGDNLDGQISGSVSSYPISRYVIGNMNWSMISGGMSFTCGITGVHPTAKLWCWGWNGQGQLGDGTFTPHSAPTLIGVPEEIVTVSAGGQHSCGLTQTGNAYCWGGNNNGQLGDGTTTNRPTPTAVSMPAGVAFASISSGEWHTCAISTSASTPADAAFCWGRNFGNLGDDTEIQRELPVQVLDVAGFSKVVAGRDHTCGLVDTSLYCWGQNGLGQVGDGTFVKKLKPAAVSGSFQDVSVGMATSCALDLSGNAYCWGDNALGISGDGGRAHKGSPHAVPGGFAFTSIRVGGSTACGLESSGSVRCWGDDRRGQLGDGTMFTPMQPQGVVGTHAFTGVITMGWGHTCALDTGGTARCWGGNWAYQIGDGSTDLYKLSPGAVTTTSGPQTFTTLTSGESHTCALTSSGAAWCWGQNFIGQRGDGTTSLTSVATEVGGAHVFSSLAAGYLHTCGVDTAGDAWCWGRNSEGQLGNGGTSGAAFPTPALVSKPGGVAFATIFAGKYHTCALSTTGATYCWGFNNHGQLGDGSTTIRTTATLVTGPVFSTLALGTANTCGLALDGNAHCWGGNYHAQIGDGTFTGPVLTPKAVLMPTGGVTFASLTGGADYNCAVSTLGVGYCWGSNYWGNFGNGTFFRSTRPTQVFF